MVNLIKLEKATYNEFKFCTEWRRSGVKPDSNTVCKLELKDDPIGLFDLIDKGIMQVYYAKIDKEIAGYISASIIPKPDARIGTMFVDEVWVPDEYRGNGIAKLLMKKVIDESERMGMWRTRLYVAADNPGAIRCYESVGMVRDEGSCYFYEK